MASDRSLCDVCGAEEKYQQVGLGKTTRYKSNDANEVPEINVCGGCSQEIQRRRSWMR